jgi:hypothetical protein
METIISSETDYMESYTQAVGNFLNNSSSYRDGLGVFRSSHTGFNNLFKIIIHLISYVMGSTGYSSFSEQALNTIESGLSVVSNDNEISKYKWGQ